MAGAMLLFAGSIAGAELLRFPTWTELGALAYLAVVVTAGVCIAWFAAMDRLGAARTGLFNGVISSGLAGRRGAGGVSAVSAGSPARWRCWSASCSA